MRIGPDEYVIIVSKYSLTDNNKNNGCLDWVLTTGQAFFVLPHLILSTFS